MVGKAEFASALSASQADMLLLHHNPRKLNPYTRTRIPWIPCHHLHPSRLLRIACSNGDDDHPELAHMGGSARASSWLHLQGRGHWEYSWLKWSPCPDSHRPISFTIATPRVSRSQGRNGADCRCCPDFSVFTKHRALLNEPA